MPDGQLTTGLDHGSVDNASLNGSYRETPLQLGDPPEGRFAPKDYGMDRYLSVLWSLVASRVVGFVEKRARA